MARLCDDVPTNEEMKEATPEKKSYLHKSFFLAQFALSHYYGAEYLNLLHFSRLLEINILYFCSLHSHRSNLFTRRNGRYEKNSSFSSFFILFFLVAWDLYSAVFIYILASHFEIVRTLNRPFYSVRDSQ